MAVNAQLGLRLIVYRLKLNIRHEPRHSLSMHFFPDEFRNLLTILEWHHVTKSQMDRIGGTTAGELVQ